MIDLGRGGPFNLSDTISYLLTLFLPLVLIRMLRRRHVRGGIELMARTDPS
jgi:hypothetical protein